MKQFFLLMTTVLLMIAGGKDLRVLVMTPTPQMQCASCENKIKSNMRFEKGVVKIETNIEKQTVTITYNAKKNNVKTLQAAMKKIGYDTRIVSDQPQVKDQSSASPKP